MRNIFLLTSLTVIFSCCTNSYKKQEDNKLAKLDNSQIEIKDKNEEKELTDLNKVDDNISNDSLFELNPAGFVIGHSENPSWDVAYILFENGDLIYTTFPPSENKYYKVGKWELKKDSLTFFMTKLVSEQGIGKKIKVQPSERHQNGEKYENYEKRMIDTLIIESYEWNDLKSLIQDESHWEWRLEDVMAADYLFNEFNK